MKEPKASTVGQRQSVASPDQRAKNLRHTRAARGLTRLDLLAMVAVIALFIALALPALSRPGSRNTRAQCAANLKRFVLATTLYAGENRDRLPTMSAGSWAWDMPRDLTDSATSGIPGLTRDLLYCPANPDQNNDGLWQYAPQYRIIGYAMTFPGTASIATPNQNVSILPQPITFGPGPVIVPAPAASQRVLVADATISQPGQNQTNAASRAAYNYTTIQGGAPAPHHTSHLDMAMPAGGNLGMLDGHAEWRQFADMIPRTTAGGTPVFWW